MDFFSEYLKYAGVGESEPPATFHRWAALSIVGALLGRKTWIPFGHSQIYPNNYIMFMGNPGARKSTAINIAAKLAKQAGYTRFAADRTSKERFLLEMKQVEEDLSVDDLSVLTLDEPSETFVVAEEFTDFTGANNIEFVTMLTKLWDCPASYSQPKLTGRSVEVYQPTVNILSGNTAQNFAVAFPPEALGNGFLSRLLLIYGETTGRKVTFPKVPDALQQAMLVSHLKEMRETVRGAMSFTKEAEALCDRLYREYEDIEDGRFKSYNTRRFTHLLKLSICMAATRLSTVIIEQDLIRANTMLHYAERKMPKALGEFGKSRLSDLSSSVMDLVYNSKTPVSLAVMIARLQQDISSVKDLHEVVKKLEVAEKIKPVNRAGKVGYVANHKERKEWDESLLCSDWLTIEELVT